METNVKAIRSIRNTTITVSTIGIIVVVVLTVLFALLMINGGSANADVMGSTIPVDTLKSSETDVTDKGLLAIGAGISCIGMLGAGIGQGYAGGKAAEAVGRNPEAEGKIRNMMIVGAAIAESSALYALVIAIMCLFVA